MDMEVHTAYRGSSADDGITPGLGRGVLPARNRLRKKPAGLKLMKGDPRIGAASRPHSAPLYGSALAITREERSNTSPAITESSPLALAASAGNRTQGSTLAIPQSQLPALISPLMFDYLHGPGSPLFESRSAALPGHTSISFQRNSKPPYEDVAMLHGLDDATDSPHSAPAARETQCADQIPLQSNQIPPVYMENVGRPRSVSHGGSALAPVVTESERVQKKVRITRDPAVASRGNAAKRRRDGFEQKDIDIVDFKYRTIKVIRMPTRIDLTPGQDPPEPTPENLPYGDDIDYPSSMLVYWLDEKELTYTESARRYRAMFPGETTTDDTVRKIHHLALLKLARKYGFKHEDEIEEPSRSVLRRGQQAGHKYNTIGGKAVYAAGAGPEIAGTVRRKRISEPTAHRGFLKACICVWKDTSDVSFEQIQHRLAKEYSWHIGVNTVQKLYYSERGRVYGTYADAGGKPARAPDAEEIVEATEGEKEL
ncbi:hypothetical protein C7974DRAFT_389726 [Boeremia exigua]|uniref:uncharacterized protein n=1 Tax=Boeremia exigua TaxID=749465 RepID=UPI001E8CB350|nr:uncharacterized protein C7974DRAFT_389726 [Boeremia exigua]KAH6637550.1 hypothetical protein C7974DRAFT_389726 [Boeremia exigua]